MAEATLLDKVKKISRSFLETGRRNISVTTVVDILAEVIDAAVFAVDIEGEPIGRRFNEERSCAGLAECVAKTGSFPGYNHGSFIRATGDEPQVNLLCRPDGCRPAEEGRGERAGEGVYLTAVPVVSRGERVATLLLHRRGRPFEHDEMILAEMGAAFAGLILMQREEEARMEDARSKTLAEVAFDSLSYSEVEAIEQILPHLSQGGSVVVASKIADDLGITRSVIVNALRKFESAGIIETRSLGMKGTYVRVKNRRALQEIAGRFARLKCNRERSG